MRLVEAVCTVEGGREAFRPDRGVTHIVFNGGNSCEAHPEKEATENGKGQLVCLLTDAAETKRKMG